VRVGDTVTVGDVDGEVTRIRMRATTITSFERKEYLVPNKDFITGKLVNWTLSDAITGMTIRVGVAYGSDTHVVTRVLLKLARNHPLVLDQPRPRALFTGFGDNSLDFQLRVFFDSLDNWARVIHDMHTLVYEKLKEAGIEIAFPQRDLHIRSVEGLSELLQKQGAVRLETIGGAERARAESRC
jgi:potassium efflux system protein